MTQNHSSRLFAASLSLTLYIIAFFAPHAEAQSGFPNPEYYYTYKEMPNMVHWLPAPPDEKSARFGYDLAQYRWGKEQRADSARAALAVRHADYSIDMVCSEFSAPLGIEISESATPEIFRLLVNGTQTCRQCSRIPKRTYKRTRPYAYFNEPTLVPEEEEKLRKNGSYPSGHTLLGMTAALLLVEVNPDAADALMKVAYEIGQSRVIAGYHWQSDVDASRMLAGAAVAKLHGSEKFLDQLRKAQLEFKAAKEKTADNSL